MASYSTSFASPPAPENPISEGGVWVNGAAVGLDWHDVQTTANEAFATAIALAFNDSIAVLNTPSFSGNHFAQATVFRAVGYAPVEHEVELLLRFSISANSATGYEFLWEASGELNIVRWNGAVGNFTALLGVTGPNIGAPADGDVFRAEARGNFLFAYKNGSLVGLAYDTTYLSGSIGLGFFPGDAGDVLASLGFKDFQCGDLSSDLQVVKATGTTSFTATMNNVTGGGALVAFLTDGSNASGPTTHTVSDAQGSYTAQGPSALDGTNAVWMQPFVLVNPTPGTHVITGTINTGDLGDLYVVEMDGGGFSGANSNFQSSPGAGADAITSGSVTVSGPGRLIGMSTDSSTATAGQEPNEGTGFTSVVHDVSSIIGSWRIETKAVAANAAATFTAVTGTHNFVSGAVAVLNASGPSAPVGKFVAPVLLW